MNTRPALWYPLKVALGCLGYASYFLSKVVFVVLVFPLFVVLLPFPRTQPMFVQFVTLRYLAFFSRVWLPLLGAYRVAEISGLENALAARPVVFVANHRSLMDAVLLIGLLPRTGVLIKSRDTRKIMNGLLARYFDLVSIDRHSLASIAATLDKSRRLLDSGKNLLIFPEGTRARSGRLQHFHRVAFDLALAAKVPVVPVILHTPLPFMAKLPGSIFPRGRNDYRIRFLDPELPRPGDDAKSLCDRIHGRMARELKQLDTGTVWEQKPAAAAVATAPVNGPDPEPGCKTHHESSTAV
jgi:1-acyl-sn-glycerol-3-phosphate acyltransferase